jgi:hypothetical protein
MDQGLFEGTRQVGSAPVVVAAIISASISLFVGLVTAIISAFASTRVARRSVNAQFALKETELVAQFALKEKDLVAQADLQKEGLIAQAELKLSELRAQAESMRQTQVTEIIKKRIDTYPLLYEIISVYGRNWEIAGKVRDRECASSFLNALIENNAKNGAFFSQNRLQLVRMSAIQTRIACEKHRRRDTRNRL